MDKFATEAVKSTLESIKRSLQEAGSPPAPNGHDILNALHTVLSSIEMLEMDVTKQQREIFGRLELGARHLDVLLQAYVAENGRAKTAALAQIDAALRSD